MEGRVQATPAHVHGGQLAAQNKSYSECQQDVKNSVRQTGRYTVRQADRQSDLETE